LRGKLTDAAEARGGLEDRLGLNQRHRLGDSSTHPTARATRRMDEGRDEKMRPGGLPDRPGPENNTIDFSALRRYDSRITSF
jgi:hypothetical protein